MGDSTQGMTRWVCHTCKSVYVVVIPPTVKMQPNGLPPSAELARTTIRCIESIFDSWGIGRTLKELVPHLKEFMLWRQTHKGHKAEILGRNQAIPSGLTPESRYDQERINKIL